MNFLIVDFENVLQNKDSRAVRFNGMSINLNIYIQLNSFCICNFAVFSAVVLDAIKDGQVLFEILKSNAKTCNHTSSAF